MPHDASVFADPANGAAIVAGTRVAMSAAANGAYRFGGPGGRVLRPLTFGERTELVCAASAAPSPRDSVAAAVLTSATVEAGEGATTLMQVLAMWLAGAAFDAPDFMETTLIVARAAGWPPRELFTAPAREVDRLAVHLDEQGRASDWKSLVFAEAPAETIDAVRDRFADRLLCRSAADAVQEAPATVEQKPRPVQGGSAAEQATPVAVEQVARVWTAAAKVPLSKGAALLPHPRSETDVAAARARSDARRTASESFTASRALRAAVLLPPAPVPIPNDAILLSSSHLEAVASVSESRRAAEAEVETPVLQSRSDAQHEGQALLRVRRQGQSRMSVDRAENAGASRVSTAAASLPRSQPRWTAAAELPFSPVAALEQEEARRFETRPHAAAPHAEDLAATLAASLDDEADLRGVER
jgi:hypothetical protein